MHLKATSVNRARRSPIACSKPDRPTGADPAITERGLLIDQQRTKDRFEGADQPDRSLADMGLDSIAAEMHAAARFLV
jgi:hypothetical protein